jgi:NAD(P)H-flavin reductase
LSTAAREAWTAVLPDASLPREFRVRRFVRDTADTFTLGLDAPDGAEFRFAPGQFNMLYAFGAGEVPISISGNPAKPSDLVHTIRAVGPATRALGRLRRGSSIGVRGPFGTAWPIEQALGKDVVVVAGGIGLAPLRPVIYELLRRRGEFRRVALVYGARSPGDLLYKKELERWRARGDVESFVTVDRGDPEWRGETGVVTKYLPRLALDPPNAVGFLCGPEAMMRFSVRELEVRGMPRQQMFVSLERNMKCAIARCGHCQLGPTLVCRDGAVFAYDRVAPLLGVREL